MSHRLAGSVCLRARADQGGRIHIVSPLPWRAESPHAEAQQRQPALPAMPYNFDLQLRAGSPVVSQSGKPFSVLPVVSLADSRLKFRPNVLQVEGTMNYLSIMDDVMQAKHWVTRE